LRTTSRLRSSAGVGITTSMPADNDASETGSEPATWNNGNPLITTSAGVAPCSFTLAHAVNTCAP
jgi:hypothetical protein